jgi:putative ABC transport system substrate-binding protein
MKRRTLLAASLAALPAGRAFAAAHTIGWISPESPETTAPFFNAFKTGMLAQRGGDQIRILDRYVAGGADDMARTVALLQQQGVSLIVTQGTATQPVVRLGPAVPIVFAVSSDPVVAGIVQSLARPGGNATGVTFMSVELNPKRIDFLRAALPACRKVGLLSNSAHSGEEQEIVACQQAVERSGVEMTVYRVGNASEVLPAVARALDDGIQALNVLPSSSMVRQSPAIIAQCLARQVPVVSGWASIARNGALLSYGPNLEESYKRLAAYVMRVLGGAPPRSLPVEQPTVFELIVNMKTAQALGIAMPPTLLAQANEIVE